MQVTDRAAVRVLAVATLLLGAAMFVEPMGIASGQAFRDNDWLNTRSFDVLTRLAILEHGQFPLRSDLVGGGFPTIAHPSDGSWAPTIVPVLLFGDVLGVKVNLLLLLFAGAWGTWRLARRWLGLEPVPALFAGLLGLSAGWLPSMLLVGFYNQAFFLLGPPVLALLLESERRPDRVLLAGGLLAVVLQQGQHAFPALCFFAGVLLWLEAAERVAQPLGLLLLLTSSLAFEAHLGPVPLVVGLGLAALWGWRSTTLRTWARRAGPAGLRLFAAVAICLCLGAGKIAGVTWLDQYGEYGHTLTRSDSLWFPAPAPETPIPWEERFYEGPGDFAQALLFTAPRDLPTQVSWGRQGDPAGYEYAWLGLTPVGVLAALGGLLLGWRDRKTRLLGLLAGLFTGVCFGWYLPPDLHFLLTSGVPRLDAFSQPIKYWNAFILLPLVLLGGVGVQELQRRVGPRAALALPLLLWPAGQSAATLAAQFRLPVPTPAVEPEFQQVAQIAEPWWIDLPPETIRAASDELHLRDYVRADVATEYVNAQRGVGTIDWYGSVTGAETAVPAKYVTLDGVVLDNPGYRGEAWVEGAGTVAVRSTPNRIELDVALSEPSTVVVNQHWLPGFSTDVGTLRTETDLLTLELPPGEATVTLRYRPARFLLGLAASGLALLLWLAALVAVRRGSAATAA